MINNLFQDDRFENILRKATFIVFVAASLFMLCIISYYLANLRVNWFACSI